MPQDGPDMESARRMAENYERYFVPAIGVPVAGDLLTAADLHPGERVLDAACGTGVVARLAAERVAPGGRCRDNHFDCPKIDAPPRALPRPGITAIRGAPPSQRLNLIK